MPVLTPAELWERTGRYAIPEVFKLQDRAGRRFVLPMTHEETVTFHALEIQSYRQLPQMLYHFSVKNRDEPRPRGGLLRVREFIMKDSYSFDRDEEGLDVSFRKHAARLRAHLRALRDRGRRRAGGVRDDGRERVDRLPRPVRQRREHPRHLRRCDYAADLEIAQGVPRAPVVPGAARRPGRGRDAGRDDDRRARRRSSASTRQRPRRRCRWCATTARSSSGSLRGRRPARGGEARRRARPGVPARRPRTRSAPRSAPTPARSARSGSPARSSPTRRCAMGSSSRARTAPAGTSAASSTGGTSRRGSPTSASRARATRCPRCGGALRFQTAIEVGHIFKLGTRYSEPLGATFLDEDGQERTIVMGSYGIGPGRVMAAAVEQRHDEQGIVWPGGLAPYDVHVLSLAGAVEEVAERGRGGGRGARRTRGHDVLLDDRDAPPRREVRRRRPARLLPCGSRSARRRSRTALSTCAAERTGWTRASRATP